MERDFLVRTATLDNIFVFDVWEADWRYAQSMRRRYEQTRGYRTTIHLLDNDNNLIDVTERESDPRLAL